MGWNPVNSQTQKGSLLIKNATVLTVTKGNLENTDVLVQDGIIKQVGQNLSAASGVQTIDATGRPCTTTACLTSTENLTCSAVVYGAGATNADRFEGFRITGGRGLFRDFGPTADPPNAVVGGGFMIFNGSPTITNNTMETITTTPRRRSRTSTWRRSRTR